MIEQEKIALAQQLATWFVQGDFEAVVQSLDESLRQQLPVGKTAGDIAGSCGLGREV